MLWIPTTRLTDCAAHLRVLLSGCRNDSESPSLTLGELLTISLNLRPWFRRALSYFRIPGRERERERKGFAVISYDVSRLCDIFSRRSPSRERKTLFCPRNKEFSKGSTWELGLPLYLLTPNFAAIYV